MLLRNNCMKSVKVRSFFWSAFSRIQTEYGNLLCKSPYSVRMSENTYQKKLRLWTLFTEWIVKYQGTMTLVKLSCNGRDCTHYRYIDYQISNFYITIEIMF